MNFLTFFILLNSWICLHGLLDEAVSQSVFERTLNLRNSIHYFIHSCTKHFEHHVRDEYSLTSPTTDSMRCYHKTP